MEFIDRKYLDSDIESSEQDMDEESNESSESELQSMSNMDSETETESDSEMELVSNSENDTESNEEDNSILDDKYGGGRWGMKWGEYGFTNRIRVLEQQTNQEKDFVFLINNTDYKNTKKIIYFNKNLKDTKNTKEYINSIQDHYTECINVTNCDFTNYTPSTNENYSFLYELYKVTHVNDTKNTSNIGYFIKYLFLYFDYFTKVYNDKLTNVHIGESTKVHTDKPHHKILNVILNILIHQIEKKPVMNKTINAFNDVNTKFQTIYNNLNNKNSKNPPQCKENEIVNLCCKYNILMYMKALTNENKLSNIIITTRTSATGKTVVPFIQNSLREYVFENTLIKDLFTLNGDYSFFPESTLQTITFYQLSILCKNYNSIFKTDFNIFKSSKWKFDTEHNADIFIKDTLIEGKGDKLVEGKGDKLVRIDKEVVNNMNKHIDDNIDNLFPTANSSASSHQHTNKVVTNNNKAGSDYTNVVVPYLATIATIVKNKN